MDPYQSPVLAEILANRRWWERREPFRHFVGWDVFAPDVYETLEESFREFLSRGLADRPGTDRFGRSASGYDAFMVSFRPNTGGAFRIFLSRAWHDMLASLAGVNATRDVSGGLHYHLVGSASGKLHNDFNPGWFANAGSGDGVNVSSESLCNYKTGAARSQNIKSCERVRAAAMLFYLNNPAWTTGDGGETGLYRDSSDSLEQAAAIVPPVNNSILLFECTPTSWHSFRANRRHPRSSVILWLHRPKTEVEARWGKGEIVRWP